MVTVICMLYNLPMDYMQSYRISGLTNSLLTHFDYVGLSLTIDIPHAHLCANHSWSMKTYVILIEQSHDTNLSTCT